MAATQVVTLLLLLISFFSLLLHHRLPRPREGDLDLKACKFDAIYQLGDSLSDTGNIIYEEPTCFFSRLPYGETFFNRSTGRCSNGLLMIDYIAQSAGLPLLNPYLSNDSVFAKDQGVNFAVAGSTALSPNVLAEKNIISLVTNSSLSVQLHWMSTHFNSLCLNANDCAEKLKRSLFMVGEIGGNDFNYALQQANKTIQEAMEMVPQVVQAIKDAVQTVIGYGALKIVVPGNFPIGCFPVYLTDFQTNDSSAYDEYHCLKELNEFSIYQNDHLKIAIEDLKQKHPNVSILYGDYYNAFQWVLMLHLCKNPAVALEVNITTAQINYAEIVEYRSVLTPTNELAGMEFIPLKRLITICRTGSSKTSYPNLVVVLFEFLFNNLCSNVFHILSLFSYVTFLHIPHQSQLFRPKKL